MTNSGDSEVQRVVDRYGSCRQGQAHAGRGQLADEHFDLRVRLECLHLLGAVSHVALDDRVSDALFRKHPADRIDLRDKAGKHHDLLSGDDTAR